MQRINNEQFALALQKADEKTKELLASEVIYSALERVLQKQNLSINPTQLVLPVGYYYLGLFKLDEVVTEMEALGIPNGLRVMADVKEAIESTPSVSTLGSTPTLDAEIAATEASIKNLEPVQTMASDMQTVRNNDVPSYQSSQDDILQQKDPSARWDSDTRQ